MIQDLQTATRAAKMLEEANDLLKRSSDLIRANCPPAEWEAYCKNMSHVTGRLFFLLMEPIYRQHPSLAPPDTPQDFSDAWNKQLSQKEPKPKSE